MFKYISVENVFIDKENKLCATIIVILWAYLVITRIECCAFPLLQKKKEIEDTKNWKFIDI